jgi:hypothetical protein
VEADFQNGICLGETVRLEATYEGGVNTDWNSGIIQWYYRLDGGTWTPVDDLGGSATHKPAQYGTYEYMVTYTPSNEHTGCDIDPRIYPSSLEVVKPVQLKAEFDLDLIRQVNDMDLPLNTCANDIYTTPIILVIRFDDKCTLPIYFTVKEDNGTVRNLRADDYIYELAVTPSVTTVYTIESMTDQSKCTTGTFVKSDITVWVTDVVLFSTIIEACDTYAELLLTMNSYVSKIATIEYPDLGLSWTQPIDIKSPYSILRIDVPTNAPVGANHVIVTIDKCVFDITLINNYSNGAAIPLIVTRWEGIGEVLVVNNNPANNGGYKFTAYQWYKNDELIPGATQQYYQDPNGVNGTYYVRLTGTITRADGTVEQVEFKTCPQVFTPTQSMRVYPVPAHVDEPVILELDLTPAEFTGAVLDIYDAKGAHIMNMPITGSITRIEGMRVSGMYTGKITTGTNEIKAIKFVIVQ